MGSTSLQRVEYVLDGINYPVEFAYDSLGRPKQVTYPHLGSSSTESPIRVENTYDGTSGTLTDVTEIGANATRPLWHLAEAYQGQLLKQETFGNGAVSTYSYDDQSRFPTGIKTTLPVPVAGGGLSVTSIQDIAYTPYADLSVHTRTDRLGPGSSVQKTYNYDVLHRLASVQTALNGAPAGGDVAYGYDVHGNLTNHGAVTNSYVADPVYPYRLYAVGNNGYSYDANGNVELREGPDIPGNVQTFEYTPFDMPHTITTGGSSDPVTRIDYDAEERRVALRTASGTRHYAGRLYERFADTQGATVEERFRIYAGSRNLGEIVRRPGQSDQTLFFHTDHLGSVDTITTNLHEYSHQEFEPFGENSGSELTRRAFTGHDNDSNLGLIDMGGRVYDPLAGRFLTEDPVMQAPFWSQGLNPYSYVFNDPINNNDPTGFMSDSFWSDGWDSALAVPVAGAGVVGGAYLSTLSIAGPTGATSSIAAPTLGSPAGAGIGGPAGGGAAGLTNAGISRVLEDVFGDLGKGSGGTSVTYAGGNAASKGSSRGDATNQNNPGMLGKGQEVFKGDWRTPPAPQLAQSHARPRVVPWNPWDSQQQAWAYGKVGKWLAEQWEESDLKQDWEWLKAHIKAPGVPTAADGFYPPKEWNGETVRSPNGRGFGFPDRKGRVWIPSGEDGHGGPHWDVQKPGGGYDNVYPGGKIRPGRN